MPGTNGRGGARPGAGRKSGITQAYQATLRGIIEEEVTVDRWRAIVRMAIRQAEDEGDPRARDWLASWVVGKVPDQLNLNIEDDGDDSLTTQERQAIRRALLGS